MTAESFVCDGSLGSLGRAIARTAARVAPLPIAAALVSAGACRDLSSFTTLGDRYEGPVVQGAFVRAGVDAATTLCLTIDADHLQDTPGAISTSDGRFQAAALRPIPQIWHDPLSTLTFGEGRLKNLVYVASANGPAGTGEDFFAVISLMQSGDVEVRLIRGAPVTPVDGAASGATTNVFAVFDLLRKSGPCGS